MRNTVGPRVLLVEDDCRSHQLLRLILVHAGCTVISAMTQADGLDWLGRCRHLECVILDLGLPDGDGEAVLEQIRSQRLDVRVAVTTAEEDPERLRRVAALKPDLFLRKPVDLPALLDWLGLSERPQGAPRIARTERRLAAAVVS
jgi:two-component system KDP operon response regulator KdpE